MPEINNHLDQIVFQVNNSSISTIQSVVTSIIRIINDPNSTAKDIEEIIQVDAPLAARVLKVANSAYYSPQNRISEIDQAVIWLGLNTVRELVLSQKVCEIFQKNEVFEGYSRPSLWLNSFAVALFSKIIYRREFGERGENAYVAGLLHNIGLIAIDQFMQNEFRTCLSEARNSNENLFLVERKLQGFDHQDVGRAITNNWRLPVEYVMAIGHHHSPDKVLKEHSRITCTLYIADHYCKLHEVGYSDAPVNDDELFKFCMNSLNLKSHSLDLIGKKMQVEIEKMIDMGIF